MLHLDELFDTLKLDSIDESGQDVVTFKVTEDRRKRSRPLDNFNEKHPQDTEQLFAELAE